MVKCFDCDNKLNESMATVTFKSKTVVIEIQCDKCQSLYALELSLDTFKNGYQMFDVHQTTDLYFCFDDDININQWEE